MKMNILATTAATAAIHTGMKTWRISGNVVAVISHPRYELLHGQMTIYELINSLLF